MAKKISEQVAGLPAMNKAELQAVWAEHFHEPPRAKLRKELMVALLAYRIQERAYGGLSNSARQKLQQLGAQLRSGKRPQTGPNSNLKSGTRFIRSWGGEVHEVSVTNSGLEYRGKQFRSLSEIAREITGTRWSGPLFFGTRKKAA